MLDTGYIEVKPCLSSSDVLKRARKVVKKRVESLPVRKVDPIGMPPPPPPPPEPVEPILPKAIFTGHRGLLAWLNPPAKLKRKQEGTPTLDEIRAAVLALHHIRLRDFMSSRRFGELGFARMHFYYLARKHTSETLPSIGRFVDKDHATVIHGMRRFDELRKKSKGAKYHG